MQSTIQMHILWWNKCIEMLTIYHKKEMEEHANIS